jgi:ATP-dependent Clp protease ATP-binding subunit ClpA
MPDTAEPGVSPRVKQLMFEAKELARGMGSAYLGPEHFVLALTTLPSDEFIVHLLQEFKVDLDTYRKRVEAASPNRTLRRGEKIAHTPRLRKVLLLAIKLAGPDVPIEPEHVLTAIVRERENFGMQLLVLGGLRIDDFEQRLRARFEGLAEIHRLEHLFSLEADPQ